MDGSIGNLLHENMIEDNDEWEFEDRFAYEFTKEDVYLLYHCVCETIRLWPGAPARPYHEQEHLRYLRDQFYIGVLEHKFNHMESDREQDRWMYREEHLQKKSDECAQIWREWFDLFQKKIWRHQNYGRNGASVVMNSEQW